MTDWTFVVGFADVVGLLTEASGADAAPRSLDCIDDWSVASRIVKKADLTAVEDLAGLAQRLFGGVIVRAALCR